MSLFSIPEKMIESVGKLADKKLECSVELTKLIYKNHSKELKTEDVLGVFHECLDSMINFLPQDQANHILPKADSSPTPDEQIEKQ